jgi:hypothetical protein
MRDKPQILVALVIIALPLAAMIAWMLSRPSWQMSAHNSAQGVVVAVYKSNAAQPTYTTVLTGKSIGTECDRVSRMELPATVGHTTFFDETIRPGRWTVVLDQTQLDIMERALMVDGAAEIAPQE